MTSISKTQLRRLPVSLILTFTAIGCAQDIQPLGDPAGRDATSSNNASIVTVGGAGEENSATIDATDYELWIYLDLESGLIVNPVDPESGELVNFKAPEENLEWDLAFQRFKVKSNCGISGTGDMIGVRLSGVDFATLSDAPTTGYVVDAEDSDDLDTDPDYIFLGDPPWYDYAGAPSHALSPSDAVYVVRSVDGNYFKVQFTAYYDAPGTSGFPAFRWKEVSAPDLEPDVTGPEDPSDEGPIDDSDPLLVPGQLSVDASDASVWTYISLASSALVDVDDAASSTDWDLAIQGTTIKTNGGVSGPGFGAVKVVPESEWEAIEGATTFGYEPDDDAGSAALMQWADDEDDTVFLIRTASGDYAKLKVLDYVDGIYALRSEMIPRDVTVQSATLDASDAAVYFDFLLGTQVIPEAPEDSDEWDFAITDGLLQTNGGTSGSGEGAADAPNASTLADVIEVSDGQGCYVFNVHKCDCDMTFDACTDAEEIWTEQCPCDSTFVIDEESAHGGGVISSNPAMADWHDEADSESPKAQVFVIRTRLSGYTKVRIQGHDAGLFTIDWAFSGAGQATF